MLASRSRRALSLLKSHWPILPVLALALWLRVRDLHPLFFYGDDAEYAIVASYLASNPFLLQYPQLEGFIGDAFVSQPPAVLYLFGLGMAVLGASDASAVYVSAALGVATVGVVYAVGHLLRDRAFGFVAATFLAVMPFHVGLSRKALLEAGLAFFMALAVFLALLYFRAPSMRRAVLAGVGVGLAALAKLPGFLVGVVLLLYLGVEAAAWARAHRAGDADATARLKALPKHGGAALGVAALFPLAWVLHVAAMGEWDELTAKLESQANRVAGASGGSGSTSQPWSWYLADHDQSIPHLVDQNLYALAFLGVVVLLVAFALRPVRNRGNALVLLWLAVVFGFFAVADRKVWFYTLPVTPVIALAGAYPIALAFSGLHHALAKAATRSRAVARLQTGKASRFAVQGVLAAALVVATAVPAWGAAEVAMEPKGPLTEGKFGYGVKEAALYVAAHDPGTGQVGSLLGRFTIAFYNPDSPTYHFFVDKSYGYGSGFTERQIERGEIRWIVFDTYLKNAEEEAWMQGLVDRHGGEVVETWTNDWGQVRLYRLNG